MDGFWIRDVRIPGKVVLGPMAGVTDMPFRTLCKEMGAALLYTEMISAKGLYYKNTNTNKLCEISEQEHPIALQLFGSESELMAQMAGQIEGLPFDILDINMGCPVPKVVNNGEGSALMRTPELAGKIIKQVSGAIKKPVTVKFRKGFTADTVNAVEFALAAQENGASAIALHGRTREQYYSGKADWDIMRRVKEQVLIPVIASGDIFTPEDAVNCLNETGCDGIMVARGARGNPWIFKQINYFIDNGIKLEKPSSKELVNMILRHAEMQIAREGEVMAMREMRKHIAWYTAGYKGSAAIRRQANHVETFEELKILCGDILDR